MDELILVPYEGSPLSKRALERVLTHHPDAGIHVLYVVDPMLAVYDAETEGLPTASSWVEEMEAHAATLHADAEALAADHDSTVTTATVTGRPAREILSYADEHDVDHVVMGSHGRTGVSRLVLGSVAEQVMRQSPVPVTVVR
ncbi:MULTISPECIES: universal stress protein [Haloarcula]|uniref:universal stress protein n=1 Tax=Haloarcula TaxID=2237 RepID=UPI0023EAB805|nr:universal stress protein [Halomicroarcula sp. XH51]